MKSNLNTSEIVVAGTTLAALLIVGAVFLRNKKKKEYKDLKIDEIEIPKKWRKVGEVGDLVFYPLKAAKRQHLKEAEFTKVGLRRVEDPHKLALQDRFFVVYNEKHEFLSIKKNTKILFVETEAVDECRVKFSYPDSDDLIVEIPSSPDPTMSHIEIYFGETIKTVDCGDKAAAWFSKNLLNKPTGLRLGCFLSSLVPPRSFEGPYSPHAKVYKKFHNDYMGTYHNLASYLLLSEASITDLNSRICRSPVNPHYYRPNIVVKDSKAFSEDEWDWIKIGDEVVLRGFKKCVRCTVTTIDPDTGARDPKFEPLKTLKTYRHITDPEGKKVDAALGGGDGSNLAIMGLYAGCHRTGIVRLGDPIYVNVE